MPFARLIPCLDVAHGRVVKGVSFVGLRDVGDPVELAQFYSDGGADELVFLDIAATPEDAATMTSVVARVADVLEIPFTVGGGVRSVADATRIIESGADRVALNSAALADPSLITAIAHRYAAKPSSSRSTPATGSSTPTAGAWRRRGRPSRGLSRRPSGVPARSS